MNNHKNLQEPVHHGTHDIPLMFYELNTEVYSDYYLHWHEEMEILYIEKNAIIVPINQEVVRAGAGDFILIGRRMLHSISKDRAVSGILYFKSLLFNLRMLQGCTEDFCQNNLAEPLMSGRMEFPLVIKPQHVNYPNIKKTFFALFDVYKKKEAYYEYQLKGLLFLLFSEFLKSGDFRLVRKNSNKTSDSLITALDYIQNNYSENITVARLASLVGYNESYFMKVFKNHTGKTVVHFINDYRLAKSSELLLQSSLAVEEIAYQTGFESASYYIRKFKELYKITPKEFRKTAE